MRGHVPTLGHDLIDRQHRRLAVAIAALHAANRRNRPIRGLMGRLLRETRRHFASEERLMRASGYADLSGHLALHRMVLQDMQRFQATLASGLPLHARQSAQIGDWLAHHADAADRNLVAWLARRA